MLISDWSSDVFSSDLRIGVEQRRCDRTGLPCDFSWAFLGDNGCLQPLRVSHQLRTCAFGWQRCNIRGGRIGELEHFGIFCLADDPAVMYRTAIVHRAIIEQAPGRLQQTTEGGPEG